MVILFGWPFLLLFGIGWLFWQCLKLMGMILYALFWFMFSVLLPGVLYLIAIAVYATVRWVVPAVRKQPSRTDLELPKWTGWTPPNGEQ